MRVGPKQYAALEHGAAQAQFWPAIVRRDLKPLGVHGATGAEKSHHISIVEYDISFSFANVSMVVLH